MPGGGTFSMVMLLGSAWMFTIVLMPGQPRPAAAISWYRVSLMFVVHSIYSFGLVFIALAIQSRPLPGVHGQDVRRAGLV